MREIKAEAKLGSFDITKPHNREGRPLKQEWGNGKKSPTDGGNSRQTLGQPRGIRLRQEHVGWDFDIPNDPQSGEIDWTAILKS